MTETTQMKCPRCEFEGEIGWMTRKESGSFLCGNSGDSFATEDAVSEARETLGLNKNNDHKQ